MPGRIQIFLAIIFYCLSTALAASDQAAINFSEIRDRAVLADAAYKAEAAIRASLEAPDYELAYYHTIAGTQVAFFPGNQRTVSNAGCFGTGHFQHRKCDGRYFAEAEDGRGHGSRAARRICLRRQAGLLRIETTAQARIQNRCYRS